MENQNQVQQRENQDNVPRNAEMQILEDTVTETDNNLQQLGKQACVVGNIYYFCQGIVFPALSQESSPKCNQRYIFLLLSLVPFFLNGIPLIIIGRKYVKAKIMQDRYNLRCEQLRNPQNQNGGQQQPNLAATTDGYRKGLYYFCYIGGVILLLVFNGVVIAGCITLPCQSAPNSTMNCSGDCFKLCNKQNKCLNVCTQ